MTNIVDKKARSIGLTFRDDQELVALHHGKTIGSFDFRYLDDTPTDLWELWHMNVDAAYQQAGIGAEMMRLAVEIFGYFVLPKPIYFVDAENYLSEEGAKLVNHCFRNGILPPEFRRQYELE